MIRMIRGTVAHLGLSAVVIDVGGVGYQVYVTVPTSKFVLGAEITLHTHLAVRENALDLYGFVDHDTLEVFELPFLLLLMGAQLWSLVRQTVPTEVPSGTTTNVPYVFDTPAAHWTTARSGRS